MTARQITTQTAGDMLPPRAGQAKWDYGRLLCLCGSPQMPGAAALCCMAAARAGVGLVRLAAQPQVAAAVAARLPECTYSPPLGARGLAGRLDGCTAILAGPGLGRGAEARALTEALVAGSPVPMVLDADALYFVAENPALLLEKKAPVILTPHVIEMSRITGLPAEDIRACPGRAAGDLAEKYGVCTVLKGPETYIAAPGGALWVNNRPNTGLSKGGSGDVLAGIIASLLAQGPCTPENAAVAGVFLHSLAGAIARRSLTEYAMLPTDVIACLPQAFGAIIK